MLISVFIPFRSFFFFVSFSFLILRRYASFILWDYDSGVSCLSFLSIFISNLLLFSSPLFLFLFRPDFYLLFPPFFPLSPCYFDKITILDVDVGIYCLSFVLFLFYLFLSFSPFLILCRYTSFILWDYDSGVSCLLFLSIFISNPSSPFLFSFVSLSISLGFLSSFSSLFSLYLHVVSIKLRF